MLNYHDVLDIRYSMDAINEFIISPIPLHALYITKLPPCLYISSTLLGAACPSPIWGIGYHLLFDAPDLSSGLSLEHMVGFSLVHSLLGFLCCESWVRLN